MRCEAVTKRAQLSSASAMRVLAAVVTLAACAGLHALDPPSIDTHQSTDAHSTLGSSSHLANRLLTCGKKLGPAKCISVLSLWRAENAVEALQTDEDTYFDLREDLVQFPWEHYSNVSDEQLYEQLSEKTENLLRYRSLSLSVPGYVFELESKGNGTLNVDVTKNSGAGSKRSSIKKYEKDFYNILPLLMVPGLIMSAILPFVLPALKLMTVAVGMINNMALSGAVFTLLRNNAFTDHYEKKVIYVNEGYKNEKLSPVFFKEVDIPLETIDFQASGSNLHPIAHGEVVADDLNLQQFTAIPNADWIKQYYGNGDGGIAVATKVRRSSKISANPHQV